MSLGKQPVMQSFSDMWANIVLVLYFNEFREATSDTKLLHIYVLSTNILHHSTVGEHQVEVICHEQKFWIGPGTAIGGLSRFGV